MHSINVIKNKPLHEFIGKTITHEQLFMNPERAPPWLTNPFNVACIKYDESLWYDEVVIVRLDDSSPSNVMVIVNDSLR